MILDDTPEESYRKFMVFRQMMEGFGLDIVDDKLLNRLQELDPVAYVRFASVYREFKDVNTFMDELKKILDK